MPDPDAELPSQQRDEAPQIVALRDAGYTADFEVMRGELVLRGQGPVSVGAVHIDEEYRFEGSSDPEDEALVLALHGPGPEVRGVLVTAYGPSASADEAEVLTALAAAPRCR